METFTIDYFDGDLDRELARQLRGMHTTLTRQHNHCGFADGEFKVLGVVPAGTAVEIADFSNDGFAGITATVVTRDGARLSHVSLKDLANPIAYRRRPGGPEVLVHTA